MFKREKNQITKLNKLTGQHENLTQTQNDKIINSVVRAVSLELHGGKVSD